MKRLLCLLLSLIFVFSGAAFAAAAQTEELYYLPGDVNNDGTVTTADARLILRLVVALENEQTLGEKCNDAQNYDYMRAADPDRDGNCAAADARLTLRSAIGLERLPAVHQLLNVNIGEEPDTLDPAFAMLDNEHILVSHLFAGLTKYELDQDGKYVIAADCAAALPVCTVNPEDGKATYVFTLREHLRWSDGTPLTAADFVYAWNRAAAPDTEAPYSYLFADIDGYFDMQDDPTAKLNVRAQGNTLTVVTTAPCAYLFDLLTNSIFMPVRQSVVESNEDWADEASSLVCNGAFTMSQWSASQIELIKNEYYKDAHDIKLEKITFSLSTDKNTVLQDFNAGKLHFTNNGDAASEYEISDPVFRNVDLMGVYYYIFNVNKSLLPASSGLKGAEKEKAEAEIRKAIALLVNRQAILEKVDMPAENAASTMVPKSVKDASYGERFYENAGHADGYHGYYDTNPLAYEQNCKNAVATLRKYYSFDEKTGKFTNFPGIELLHNGVGHEIIAESIQKDLGKYGLRLDIREVDWPTLTEARANGDFELVRDGWIADYNDAVNFLEMFYSESGNNCARLGVGSHASVGAYSLDLTPLGLDYAVSDATWAQTYDILIGTAYFETDPVLRSELLHMAEDLLMETGAVMPLYYYSSLCLQSTNVQGIFSTPYGLPVFTNAVMVISE